MTDTTNKDALTIHCTKPAQIATSARTLLQILFDDTEFPQMVADQIDQLARLAVAAGELAELIGELLESESEHMTEWDETATAALARFRAIAEGEE